MRSLAFTCLFLCITVVLPSCSDLGPNPERIRLQASLAFMHTKNLQNETDIYLLDLEGRQHPLVVRDGSHRRPSWSSDGSFISYASVRGSAAEIFVVDRNGMNERNITNDPSWDERPVWSPNGSRIVFESSRTNGHDLFVINSSGGTILALTQGGVNTEPNWSPNAQSVVYSSDSASNRDLYLVNVTTLERLKLTNTPDQDEQAPSWSPSASLIAFICGGRLEFIRSDGTHRTSFENLRDSLDAFPPQWSPDGQNLIVVSISGQLWRIHLPLREAQPLLYPNIMASRPRLSPDGRTIAFEGKAPSGRKIFLVSLDGSDLQQITFNAGDDWFPVWCPQLN